MKTKYIILALTSVLIITKTSAQSNKKSSFVSKLYFPFDVGYVISPGNGIESGSIVQTALEYRFHYDHGFFIRFNYDNRSNDYKRSGISGTNVTEGKLKFSDYLTGVGYRVKTNSKFRPFGLVQGGISTFEFPTVAGPDNSFIVQDKQRIIPILKMTTGIEYYIAKNAALTIEAGYIYHFRSSPFWNDHMQVLGVSVGLTAALF